MNGKRFPYDKLPLTDSEKADILFDFLEGRRCLTITCRDYDISYSKAWCWRKKHLVDYLASLLDEENCIYLETGKETLKCKVLSLRPLKYDKYIVK